MSTFSDDVFLPGLRPLLPDSFRSLKKEKMRFKYNKIALVRSQHYAYLLGCLF